MKNFLEYFTEHQESQSNSSKLFSLMKFRAMFFSDEKESEPKVRFHFRKIIDKTIEKLDILFRLNIYIKLHDELTSNSYLKLSDSYHEFTLEKLNQRLENTEKELEQLKVEFLEVIDEY